MLITYSGTNTSFLEDGFFNSNGTTSNTNVTSNNSTQIVLFNSDSGVTTTLTGTGFVVSGDGVPMAGTISDMSFSQNGITQGTMTTLNWGLVALNDALEAIDSNGNFSLIAALFNSASSITVDASNAGARFDARDFFSVEILTQLTPPMTVTGSAFSDALAGGSAMDTIAPGSNTFGEDYIVATAGNDTIDFSTVSPQSFAWLDYEELVNGPVVFNVNGATNTGTVSAGGFTDTLVDVARIMEADGLGLEGGETNDTFNVTSHPDGWFMLRGNEGNDTYNVTVNGGGRITFNRGTHGSSPTQGAVVNLMTGVVSNDGFGFTDQINVQGDGRLEIQGTHLNDSFIGSDRNESFITGPGNDTVDGGGGIDRVRYDRNGVDALTVDLEAGTASGTWDGMAFTDSLINIEYVRGTRSGNDTLLGHSGADTLAGRGGDDSLVGRGGNDELYGEEGNDTLLGGGGRDTLDGDTGDDLLRGGSDFDELLGGVGNDTLFGDNGRDTLLGGDGNDELRDNGQRGDLGRDLFRGENGNDTLFGGGGNDTLDGGNGNDSLFGGLDDDRLFGGNQFDHLAGQAGNDTLFGGNGRDTLLGGNGNDRLVDNAQGGDLGRDILNGEAGNDLLRIGGGNDTATGGSGSDTFEFFGTAIGLNTVTDFDLGTDQLRLDDGLWTGPLTGQQVVDQFASVVGGNLIFDFGGGNAIALIGVGTTTGLAGDTFIF